MQISFFYKFYPLKEEIRNALISNHSIENKMREICLKIFFESEEILRNVVIEAKIYRLENQNLPKNKKAIKLFIQAVELVLDRKPARDKFHFGKRLLSLKQYDESLPYLISLKDDFQYGPSARKLLESHYSNFSENQRFIVAIVVEKSSFSLNDSLSQNIQDK